MLIKNTVFTGKCFSNIRQCNDFYATEPIAIKVLLEKETFSNVWECASGQGHLADELQKNNILARKSDIVDMTDDTEILDFLSDDITEWEGDIITNPPFKHSQQFVEKALDIIPIGNKVAMFLKLSFLESVSRKKLFDRKDLKLVLIPRHRINCAKNGDFQKYKSSAVCYAWFIFEKGYNKLPTIDWIY